MPRGGKRPGAGLKKGYKFSKTLEKEAAREAQRAMITRQLAPLTEAHINNAIGIKHLMLRDPKTGKFERVKDEAGIDVALASEGEAIWIYTKDPSVEAFKTLMDRALDKPIEQIQATLIVTDLDARIEAGRKKLRERDGK